MNKGLTAVTTLVLLAALAISILGPWTPYVVKTGSMTPTIPVGATVFVNQDLRPQPGQVVTFSQKGRVTTHRLLKTGETKGDANQTADPWKLSQTKVLGTVQASIPLLGYPLVFLKQPTGVLSLLLLPLLLRLAWQISSSATRPA